MDRHFSVAEVAERWGLSSDTVRRLFEREVGVLIVEPPRGRFSRRRYRTLRIPAAVVDSRPSAVVSGQFLEGGWNNAMKIIKGTYRMPNGEPVDDTAALHLTLSQDAKERRTGEKAKHNITIKLEDDGSIPPATEILAFRRLERSKSRRVSLELECARLGAESGEHR